MSIFQRLKKAGESKLGRIVLAGSLLTGVGCGNPGPSNHSPEFTSTPVTQAVENSVYSYDADANDTDGDTLEYSLAQAPAGMTINSSTGLIQWTPTDSQSAQNHQVKVQVSDGVNTTEQDFSVYAVNTETISGYISDAEDLSPLPDIDVTLTGVSTATTDSGGYWEIQNVQDGDYPVIISDSTGTYETFKPGFFRVGKLEKLTQDAIIYKKEDRGFVDSVIRLNGQVRKWLQKPKFKIYRLEYVSGTDVGDAKIQEVKEIILNELNVYTSDTYNFTESDIEVINSQDLGGYLNGFIKISFDNTIGSGYNGCQFNGNEVISAFAAFNTASDKGLKMQEMTETLIGSGETTDSAYSDSIF
ncbi:hypothetical protein DRN73_02760, partial [Candidatus Pacearchaeota archaeon]